MELLLTLLIVTFLSFLLVKLSPVDAAEAYARRTFMLYTPEQLDELPGGDGTQSAASGSVWNMGTGRTPLRFWNLISQRAFCFRRGIPRNGRHIEHCIDGGSH